MDQDVYVKNFVSGLNGDVYLKAVNPETRQNLIAAFLVASKNVGAHFFLEADGDEGEDAFSERILEEAVHTINAHAEDVVRRRMIFLSSRDKDIPLLGRRVVGALDFDETEVHDVLLGAYRRFTQGFSGPVSAAVAYKPRLGS